MNMDDLTPGEWHRRYMASLDDAKIGSKTGRKDWQAANHFPASTKAFTVDTYREAVTRILEPFVASFRRLCVDHGIEPEALVNILWSRGTWLRVRDYEALIGLLKILPDNTDEITLAASRSGLVANVNGTHGSVGSDTEA